MKKILFSLLGGAALLLSSCDMNKEPYGEIMEGNALESAKDCAQYRNGFYTFLRTYSGGEYISYPAIQMDEFFGTVLNGNRIGLVSNGQIYSNNDDMETVFANCFYVINDVNYFLTHTQKLLDSEKISAADKLAIKRYVAEGHFTRAYMYYKLMDLYCGSFNKVNPDAEGTGMPIVTDYNPTGDRSKYPGRASLNATMAFIQQDLTDAMTGITEYQASLEPAEVTEMDAPMAIYINPWIIKAFRARLALLQGQWQEAYDLASEVVTDGAYKLSTTANYAKMWTNDNNDEIIFLPFSSASESCPATGASWISASDQKMDYFPTAYVAQELYLTTDCRFKAFIGTAKLLIDGQTIATPKFIKYPGNTALNTSSTNELKNRPKTFRLSEMVLIMAEAAAELGNEDDANDALNKLRTNRITRYRAVSYSGSELTKEIRLERQRELLGEGFRISDLRRWGLGFNRNQTAYTNTAVATQVLQMAGLIEYQVDDHRYVWPIPATELRNNPQMKGQQNPGY